MTVSRFFATALFFGALAFARADVVVFASGQALLPVYVATNAPESERAAAVELVRVLKKMSGIDWPLRTAANREATGFYIGSAFADAASSRLKLASDWLRPARDEVGPDALRVEVRGARVWIESATPESTIVAVSMFLQREADVRWYAPGEFGEVVPKRSRWTLPEKKQLIQPAFLSRDFSALNSTEEKTWALHNGLFRRIDCGHALSRVFTPQRLAQHPEWRPRIVGQSFETAGMTGSDWQPNIAVDSAAVEASDNAGHTLDQDPSAFGVSLGINDSTRFDESASTREIVEPIRYFRNQPDYSNLIFGFMNRVAADFQPKHPGRYLTALAYQWGQNTPSFRLSDVVWPILAADRSQYYDASFRTNDLNLMARWSRSGVRAFGLWEYAYGRNFLVPREAFHAWSEALREGWKKGARSYFCEIEPNPGFDVFKTWMLAQLAWSPERSYEDLAADFYSGYYGPAAIPMRHFFEGCEQAWMNQGGEASWLKDLSQADQALIFPLSTCRRLQVDLERAEQQTRSDPTTKLRVDLTIRAFAVTEALARLAEQRARLETPNIASDRALLSDGVKRYLTDEDELRKKYSIATDGEFPAMRKVELGNYLRDDPISRLLWLAKRDGHLSALNEINPDLLEKTEWQLMVKTPLSDWGSNELTNASFRAASNPALHPDFLYRRDRQIPTDWGIRAQATEEGMLNIVSTETAERNAIRITDASDAQCYQWRPANSGRAYLATAEMRGNSSAGNEEALFVAFLSASGKRVGEYRMQALPKGLTRGWREMALAAIAPSNAAWIGVGVGVARQAQTDWVEVKNISLRVARSASHDEKNS